MEKDSQKTAQAILDEARAVKAERQRIYGSPYPNHRRIADLWTAYLDTPITPDQVAICMGLTKISRLTETPGDRNRDSYVDLVAYAALAYECAVWEPDAD